jgi:hypothetical protein
MKRQAMPLQVLFANFEANRAGEVLKKKRKT